MRHPAPKLLKNAKGGTRDTYGNAFVAVAICSCGHEAQLPGEWVKLAASYGVALQKARARLRCSRCGGRMPRVEVYGAQA
jgi:hypothetical protein